VPDAPAEVALETVSCVICGSAESSPVAAGFDYEYWTTLQEFRFVACAGCGHVYLNPRPVPRHAGRIYPSDYYTLRGRHSGNGSRLIARLKNVVVRRRLAYFAELLKGPCRVLDIGCGDCALLLSLKGAYPHVELAGIDLAVPASARKACADRGITLTLAPVEGASLPDDRYDLIIMNQVIEHLWDPTAVLTRLHACLRDGGHLSIETPNAAGYDRRCFVDGAWGGYYFLRHMNLFTFESLARLLVRTGFDVVLQRSLVAPIVWAFSLKALAAPTPSKANAWLAKFLSDRNPLCLGAFTLVDRLAIATGRTTSNQKTLARKTASASPNRRGR